MTFSFFRLFGTCISETRPRILLPSSYHLHCTINRDEIRCYEKGNWHYRLTFFPPIHLENLDSPTLRLLALWWSEVRGDHRPAGSVNTSRNLMSRCVISGHCCQLFSLMVTSLSFWSTNEQSCCFRDFNSSLHGMPTNTHNQLLWFSQGRFD